MKNEHSASDPRRNRMEDGARFGTIGISALAAALHYRSELRNPVKTPSKPTQDPHAEEQAA